MPGDISKECLCDFKMISGSQERDGSLDIQAQTAVNYLKKCSGVPLVLLLSWLH